MLISFSVANFRSIRGEVTLSLVADKATTGHSSHIVRIPSSKEGVLKTAIIYGANGAGKSNIFRALQYAKSIAIDVKKAKSRTGREPFRLDESPSGPSDFDIRFVASGSRYRFGCKVDDHRVLEEWLVKEIGGREIVLYERATDKSGAVLIEARALRKVSDKLDALITVGGPDNQSFLATIGANLQPADVGDDIFAVMNWFTHALKLIGPDEPVAPIAHYLEADPSSLAFASDFLKNSSTGVDGLQIKKREITERDLRALLPSKFVDDLLNELDESETGRTIIGLDNEEEILVEKSDSNHFYSFTIQAEHFCNKKKATLSLSEESDGTRRLLNLLPALHNKEKAAVFFIDEIDRSMHPMLIWKFLDFFLKSSSGAGGHQIIVTTHESNLLDLDLVRRDEVWFAEKDKSLATQLYSLADFKVRKDLGIRKHYLQGRFGGVPFLGNVDRMLGEGALQNGNCESKASAPAP
ncbi:ATP/GTP-binding protein [Frateuria sp. GZRe14]|uniref:AAA family ATPase n=1 Tax=Frateuria sp. GZRe14 TaxID=3351534 RepID=UPI003EDBC980